MSELVLAIDPGETTGWAFGRASARVFKLEAHGQIDCTEVLDTAAVTEKDNKYAEYRAVAFTLMEIMGELKPETVIIEDFTLRQLTTMKKEGISPVRIGAMLVVWLEEILPHAEPPWKGQVVWQQPSQMSVIDNPRMKTTMAEAYRATAGFPHARDAVRHCEVYRRKLSG